MHLALMLARQVPAGDGAEWQGDREGTPPLVTTRRQPKETLPMIIRFIAEEAVTEPAGAVVIRVESPEAIDGVRFLADANFFWHLRPGDVVIVEAAPGQELAPLSVSTQHTHSVATMRKWDRS
jgi:hypothetical protein